MTDSYEAMLEDGEKETSAKYDSIARVAPSIRYVVDRLSGDWGLPDIDYYDEENGSWSVSINLSTHTAATAVDAIKGDHYVTSVETWTCGSEDSSVSVVQATGTLRP